MFLPLQNGEGGRVAQLQGCIPLVLSKIMGTTVPGIGLDGVTEEGMIGVPAGDEMS